ncbi:unnamed protein product [Dovyalis caffra]|uniref:Trichome birefringence-like C-terminal domain-containing protein n=1 Tax=Dovyalis caffra TaxID=77055 RepID=A0AAV1QXS0_9ROSI|nr:unnamed protein product [Dovyalis caffra]
MRNGASNFTIISDSISKKGQKIWKKADYLIFDTYAWWIKHPTVRLIRGPFDTRAKKYDVIEAHVAFERSLRTWAKWVEEHVDPNRTKVFFNSMAPLHVRALDWNNPNGVMCEKETTPILNMSIPLEGSNDHRYFAIAKKVIRSMKFPINFLNITTLSEYRKDAHPSIYNKVPTRKQKENPAKYADCVHCDESCLGVNQAYGLPLVLYTNFWWSAFRFSGPENLFTAASAACLLGDALSLDHSLREGLPEFNFPLSYGCSDFVVVVGKGIFSCSSNNVTGDSVYVDINVETEVVDVIEMETHCANIKVENGGKWFVGQGGKGNICAFG